MVKGLIGSPARTGLPLAHLAIHGLAASPPRGKPSWRGTKPSAKAAYYANGCPATRPLQTGARLGMTVPMLALTSKAGVRLAEVGFLLIVIAGVWIVAAEVQPLRFGRLRMIVAGVLLAAAGVLLIIAVHWGHFS